MPATVMAWTALRQIRMRAYYSSCCCAMAVLLFLGPGSMAASAGGGGLLQGSDDASSRGGAGAAAPHGLRNKRWSTTFAGATANKNSTGNNVVRDCSTDSDCLDTPFTSCAIDMIDKKKRCLCADAKQPLNGDCLKKPRGPLFVPALRTSCESDVECLPNAICKNNGTISNPRLKICMCKDGFTEEKEACNYADLLTLNNTILFIGIFTSWIWNNRHALV